MYSNTARDEGVKKRKGMNSLSETLIDKLKRLYTEFYLDVLRRRMDSYNPFVRSSKHSEISDILHDLIDETVRETDHSHADPDYQERKLFEDEMASASDNLKSMHNYSVTSGAKTVNGLSQHRTGENVLGNVEILTRKLQKSVWDHVHAAHRFARVGDGDTAKLHADLAVSAMKTLSHYLPADEYEDFLVEVGNQLRSQKQQLGKV